MGISSERKKPRVVGDYARGVAVAPHPQLVVLPPYIQHERHHTVWYVKPWFKPWLLDGYIDPRTNPIRRLRLTLKQEQDDVQRIALDR